MPTKGNLRILACTAGEPFAKKVWSKLVEKKQQVGEEIPEIIVSEEVRFANREVKTVVKESIRDVDVYIFQDVENSVAGFSVDENLMALKTAIDAAKESKVRDITAVVPVFPYARQDKTRGREGISARMVARELEDVGANTILTLDVHNEAMSGFFRKAPFENLHASKNIIDFIRGYGEIDLQKVVVMPADAGGTERAEHYAKILGKTLVFVSKLRNHDSQSIERMELPGNLEGRIALIVDDMISTGTTVAKAAKLAKEKGAEKVYVICSLPLFNRNATEIMGRAYEEHYLNGVIGTDAVYHGDDFQQKNPWFIEVSVASYFAKVIRALNQRGSLSKLLE